MHLFPKSIRLPEQARGKVVYLDMNHWISLAQAEVGHPKGVEFQIVLEACLAAADAGTAVFPLSQHIYNETRKAPERGSRDLAGIMERLSSFHFVMHRTEVAKHETEALLDEILWPGESPIPPADYVSPHGPLAAGGFVERSLDRVKILVGQGEEARDITNEFRMKLREMAEKNWRGMNRDILTGSPPAEGGSLETYEWVADDHKRLARLLDDEPALREPQELRRCVAAIELDKMQDIFSQSLGTRLAARDLDTSTLDVQTKSHILRVTRQLDRMPSFDTAVSLQVSLHRNSKHSWKSNHVFDIETLAITVPYCDVVVTDKEMQDHVARTGLDERMGTCVIRELRDLPGILKQ